MMNSNDKTMMEPRRRNTLLTAGREEQEPLLCEGGGTNCNWFSFLGSSQQDHHHQQQGEEQAQPPRKTVPQQAPEDPVSSKELYELSSDERNQIYEEIHGVSDIPPDEDPEMVNYALERMEIEIQRVTKRNEYKRALFLNPAMVTSRKFRLMFLRFVKFDPCVAANKIIQHFQHKSELWGEDKVAKKLTLDDLDKDDQESLLSGCRQILPTKDRSGRTVIFHDVKHLVCNTWKNEMKSLWYILSLALEDEATQILGAVHVSYEVDAQAKNTKRKSYTKFLLNAYRIRDGLPIKSCATHFCYNSNATWSAVMLLRTVAGKPFRLRFRDHFGSYLECRYALESYGIINLPLDETGWLIKDIFLKFIETQRQIEIEEELERSIIQKIILPNSCDILMGRGKPFRGHPGNVRLLQLQKEKSDAHVKGTPSQRKTICEEVLQIVIKDWGGRFLEQEKGTGMWIILEDEIVLDKISHGFRMLKARTTTTATGGGEGGRGGGDDEDKIMEDTERSDKRQRL